MPLTAVVVRTESDRGSIVSFKTKTKRERERERERQRQRQRQRQRDKERQRDRERQREKREKKKKKKKMKGLLNWRFSDEFYYYMYFANLSFANFEERVYLANFRKGKKSPRV